jgi:3-deoxy-D-manno-octulosonic-acid transferase
MEQCARVLSWLSAGVSGLLHAGARLLPHWRGAAAERSRWRSTLPEQLPTGCLWVHCASAGEYEHIRSVLRRVRDELPGLPFVVSFFSPAGYRQHRHAPEADAVVLMAPDTPWAVRWELERLRPVAAVFVRYELWPGHLRELRRRGIPAMLVAATAPRSWLWRLPPLRGALRCLLGSFQRVLALGEENACYFRRLVSKVEAIPDPRYDRIWEAVQAAPSVEFPTEYAAGRWVLVAGSTWAADHRLLARLLEELPQELGQRLTLVLVPHVPDAAHLRQVQQLFPQARWWSQPGMPESGKPAVLVVDRVGVLLGLYRYAQAAYVGGGFGRGVHNVVEPAAYGIPVACGPRIAASPDAVPLQRVGALWIVRTAEQLRQWVERLMQQPQEYERAATAARAFVRDRLGGSTVVARRLVELLRSGGAPPVSAESAPPLG